MQYKAQYKWSPRDEQAEMIFDLIQSAKNSLITTSEHEEVLSDAGVAQLESVYSGLVAFLDNFHEMVEI
jgi:hypothetical protein